jgi:predicted nucleotidyltransferase
MFFDIRVRYASKREIRKIKELEVDIVKRLETVKSTIINEFSDYVVSFGLTGPMAKGEGTIYFSGNTTSGSDIDMAVVTGFRSLARQRQLKRKIDEIFESSPLNPGILFFAPSIFKFPDLMFCEYAATGKVIFGGKERCMREISIWEAAKILTSRCGALFDAVSFDGQITQSEDFPYAWSKSVLGMGEALLILEKKYKFSVLERAVAIKSSSYAKRIPRFLELHEKAFLCRYSGRLPKDRKLMEDTFNMLAHAFELTAGELFKRSGKRVSELSAPFPSIVATRIFYFINTTRKGKISLPLSEPLVQEFEEMRKALEILKHGGFPSEKQRRHIVHLWKHAERFWLPY